MVTINRKGQVQDIVVFLVTLFAVAVFATVMWKVGDGLQGALLDSSLNTSTESISAINTLSSTAKMGDRMTGTLFLGMLLALIISAVLVPTNIIFTVVYLVLGTLLWFLSVPLSNAYTTMVNSGTMTGMTGAMPLTYTIMNKLPAITTIILILLIVILYAKRYMFSSGEGVL